MRQQKARNMITRVYVIILRTKRGLKTEAGSGAH